MAPGTLFGLVLIGAGWRVERDRPACVVRQNAAEVCENLARAPRTI